MLVVSNVICLVNREEHHLTFVFSTYSSLSQPKLSHC